MKLLIPLLLLATLYSCHAKKATTKQPMASAAAVDTVYFENPETGELQMIITKKENGNSSKNIKTLPQTKSGDTVYRENPKTGDIEMMIND